MNSDSEALRMVCPNLFGVDVVIDASLLRGDARSALVGRLERECEVARTTSELVDARREEVAHRRGAGRVADLVEERRETGVAIGQHGHERVEVRGEPCPREVAVLERGQ